MRINEAKDFLAQQTERQAHLEGVSFSELEKRMMYFTEGKNAVEDPITLNEEFEAQYETKEYEDKISKLMDHAYKRLKKKDKESAAKWVAAMRTVRKGDHYILVLAGHPLKDGSVREWFAYGFLFSVLLAPFAFLWLIAPRRNGSAILTPPSSMITHFLQALIIGFGAIGLFFPRILLKSFGWIFHIFEKLLGAED
jgi:hypothetical protein